MVRKIKSENSDDWEGTYRSRAASPGTPKRMTRSTAKRGSGVAKLSDRSPHSHKKQKTSFQPALVQDDHDQTDEERNESSIDSMSTGDDDDEQLVKKQLVSHQREQKKYEAMKNAKQQQEKERAKRLMNHQKEQDRLARLEEHRKNKEIREKENLQKHRMEQNRMEQERLNERFKLVERHRKEKARLEQERAAKDRLQNDEIKSRELRLQEIYEKGRKAAMELSDPQPSTGRKSQQGSASKKIGKYDADCEEDDDESGHDESDSESDGEEHEDGSGRGESDTESDDEDKNDDSDDEDGDEDGDDEMSEVADESKSMGAMDIEEDSEDQDEGEAEGKNSVHGSDVPILPILPDPRPQEEGLSACLRCIKNLAVSPEFSCVFTDDYDKCIRCSTRGRRCVPVPGFAHGDVCKLLALQKLHDAARPNIRPALRIRIQADVAAIIDKVRPEESRARKTQDETLRSILLGQVGIKHDQEEILKLLRELLSRHPVEKTGPVATGRVNKGKRRV